jgi:hypothetical protein
LHFFDALCCREESDFLLAIGAEWRRALSARSSFQPVEAQDLIGGIPQPGRDFSRLKRSISRAKVTIQQNSVISSAVLGLLTLWRIASGLPSPGGGRRAQSGESVTEILHPVDADERMRGK